MLATQVGHHGPAYFFVVGIALIVVFTPAVVSPNTFRGVNAWLAKSQTIRAMARARSGTDGVGETASDTRIRVACGVGLVVGAVLLAVGIVIVNR